MEKNENKNEDGFINVGVATAPVVATISPFTRFGHWIKQHKVPVIITSVIVVACVGAGVYLWLGSAAPKPESTVTHSAAVTPPAPTKFYSPLTGLEVAEQDSKRPVTAIMVENSPEARPQSGIKDAGVVFESVAEAGITRFMLVYQESHPKLIGPVRSVRPQFASWVAAFDAGLAHVGGSSIPLAKLRSGQIKDLDQFFNAGSYYRSTDRYAPHNVYTTDDRLQALNKSKNYLSSTFTPWKHKTAATPGATPTAKTINVPVSTGLYAVTFGWDQASNSYLRSEGGKPHLDRENGQISPKVVIAMQVPHDVIKDTNGYSYPNVIGSGKAYLFQDGIEVDIHWSKASDKDQIVFTDSAGNPVVLNPGQLWITAIKPTAIPTWQ